MKKEKSVLLTLKVIPRSSITKLEKSNNEIKLKIKSPPVDGKANKEIIEFFSDLFSISKSNVIIEKGTISRHKTIRLIGVDENDISNIIN